MLREKRLYLFDIDGTLITTGGAGGQAMRLAFASLWQHADGFKGVEFSGRTDRALLKNALVALALHSDESFAEALRRFKRAYYHRLPQTLSSNQGTVLPGVLTFLEKLSGEPNATVALGTGNFRHSAGMKLAHYGLRHHFSLGGFGDHCEDRAVLVAEGIRAATRMAGRHATVFVIGDTIHDITAAKANNAVAVGVLTGNVPVGELSMAGADIVLRTLEGAEDLL